MFQFTDVTLGSVVFGIGVTYQFLVQRNDRGMPALVRLAAVAMWAGLALLLALVIHHVQNVNQFITIHAAIVLCSATVALGCGLGYGVSKWGETLSAREGGRAYRTIMEKRKEGRAKNDEWRRQW